MGGCKHVILKLVDATETSEACDIFFKYKDVFNSNSGLLLTKLKKSQRKLESFVRFCNSAEIQRKVQLSLGEEVVNSYKINSMHFLEQDISSDDD